MHIAERSLFLGISRMLWAFKFEKAEDDNSNEITPDISKLTGGLFVMPQPFSTKITPRSQSHAERVRREWADYQPLLDSDMQWKAVPEGIVFSTYNPEE